MRFQSPSTYCPEKTQLQSNKHDSNLTKLQIKATVERHNTGLGTNRDTSSDLLEDTELSIFLKKE